MIINKTRRQLPEYMNNAFLSICKKANLSPSDIDLIIKRRNRCVGDCWVKKGNRDVPCGKYHCDLKTITVRIGRKTHPDDFSFVIAHELGHLVDHKEHRDNTGYKLTQQRATDYALTCGCYPHSKYRGIRTLTTK